VATEQLFADRYRLERRLGVGGMATVQLAFDTRLERNVAHPQVALTLTDGMRAWKKKVWDLAAETIAGQKPEELDDW